MFTPKERKENPRHGGRGNGARAGQKTEAYCENRKRKTGLKRHRHESGQTSGNKDEAHEERGIQEQSGGGAAVTGHLHRDPNSLLPHPGDTAELLQRFKWRDSRTVSRRLSAALLTSVTQHRV